MKVKVSEASGAALDWMVAKCEGYFNDDQTYWDGAHGAKHFIQMRQAEGHGVHWTHSTTDWGEGGPIIERIKGFEFKQWLEARRENCCEAHIHNYEGNWVEFGTTPLEAAMRCYAASKLGDEVEVPDELIGEGK